ncbi:preprotein translocase subunit SecY [Candidatus Berkelbacteria bacterium RIFCSPLOWO2_01_FULL_50_28]|uniref:Protein translocase subunit SecY n=1 Tax=Candidatus Berkelbacteria bacterium RIFCSPLOWO2_01_FULL_50_28 TaxID=1797471 RepID=A0A1F5EBV8_9BACT|nr:MAG: preprotein translocase subunit SecY [Candidatus Berkelbacteria bacterium RIFCSPHIGHO2_01_FULL_50_36]OGD62255.1 MAG: preprotein translocase subunit SecY [Candidatus Berkelbacteria bacterium RIFCSPHIGHO2_12_FULL_50_11]OGD64898.1 MAG: preprotein translocase subunit SecY [Candidatus Berkelbacteria bacterium RIFCSPLOWO2_01_FULL_50_28]
MRETLLQIWRSRDLRGKIFFTLATLVFIRLIAHIPLPAIDRLQLDNFLNQSQNQVFGVLGIFTGGSLSNLSIDLMGVGPYITASIVVQLLTKVIPAWEEIHKEGSNGRERLNQYSRYLTIPMAIIQGYGTIALLKSQNVLTNMDTGGVIVTLLTITATSIFVMWLGELISERGIGNGISMIIALGIVAGIPQQIANTATAVQGGNFSSLIIFMVIALATVVLIVIMNDAERKLPITYPRRVISPGKGSQVDSYLPIKVNTAGVIPIIFALSFITFPTIIARFLTTAQSQTLVNIGNAITSFTGQDLYYALVYFVLVVVFTFFYTFIIFHPEEVSENLQKQGGFIPGVRPGRETAEFIRYTLSRLTAIGALFLGVISVVPLIVQNVVDISTLVIGGTSIIIVVSVVIDTNRQLSGQLSMRKYDIV